MRNVRSTLTALALLSLPSLPLAAVAQGGRVTGTVTDSAAGPVAGAQVLVSAVGLSAVSNSAGRFTIAGVPAGTHTLSVYRIGYKPVSAGGIVVAPGKDASVDVRLEPGKMQLHEVVVSAARRPEKITEAAATVTAIDASALDTRIGNSYSLALRSAPGLDVAQVGVTSVFVNGRGFNTRFNTRWLTMEDGRVAILAETGLPMGEHTTIPKLDVASLEVITGPGSALYGANASNGLLSVRTKDPRQYPGLSVELSGGSRSLRDVQARYAGSNRKWAYKLAGERLQANDWPITISYPAVTPGGAALPETITDFNTSVSRASGSLQYAVSGDATVRYNAGMSVRNGLGDSNSGHYQIDGHTYTNHQLQFSNARWMAQTYFSHSNTGDTYQLYSAVPMMARNPGLSADSVRELTRFHLDGRLYAAELQNNFLAGMLARTGVTAIDHSLISWGVQARRSRVSSYQTLYSDALTGEPILLDSKSVYAQVETPLTKTIRVVAAGRLDAASRYDAQFSPRVSAVYTPVADQTFRVTYGEAYRSPPMLQTDLYVLLSPTARYIGNRNGFTIKDSAGRVVNNIGRLLPETNKSWELGYKAVLANRLFADITLYHSTFTNFISGGLIIADPASAAKTSAYDAKTGELFSNAGKPVRVSTNYNLGEGIAGGLDAAFRFYLSDHVSLASTLSLTRLDTIKTKPTDPGDAGQFNTSSNRTSLTLETTDLPPRFGTSASVRYVNGYLFRSGVIWGRVPSYGMIDLAANYRLPNGATVLLAQAQNIAACVSGTSTPPATGLSPNSMATFTPGTSCGLGLKHQELLSMPALGATLLVGVRHQWR